jgi:hypothetical protein
VNRIKSLFEIKPFDPKLPYHVFHFHLLQFFTFFYLAYRLMSRNFGFYGLLDISNHIYPRAYVNYLFFSPPKIFTLHFFHNLFGATPGPVFITLVQCSVIGVAILGLLGLRPKVMACLAFIGFLYLRGFILATNAELDGSELLLCSLLVLTISDRRDFYSLFRRRENPWSPTAGFSIFLLMIFCGAYYTFAGMNKLIDIGPHWPFFVNLYNIATDCTLNAVFTSSRYMIPEMCVFMLPKWLSPISGLFSLIGELGFITILFLPRLRWFFVFSMIGMHTLVLASAGINFTGNSFILLLCLDWNRITGRLKTGRSIT